MIQWGGKLTFITHIYKPKTYLVDGQNAWESGMIMAINIYIPDLQGPQKMKQGGVQRFVPFHLSFWKHQGCVVYP